MNQRLAPFASRDIISIQVRTSPLLIFSQNRRFNNCRTQLANLRLSDFFHKTRPRYTILGCDFNYADCKNAWKFVVSQLFSILKLEWAEAIGSGGLASLWLDRGNPHPHCPSTSKALFLKIFNFQSTLYGYCLMYNSSEQIQSQGRARLSITFGNVLAKKTWTRWL